MLIYNRVVTTCFSIFVIMMTVLVQLSIGRCETMSVHDPNIDIALLYDQSGTMALYKDQLHLWEAMRDWIRKYFLGSHKGLTRFAVMGCGSLMEDSDVTPLLYLDGSSDNKQFVSEKLVDKILQAQEEARGFTAKGMRDNVGGCARSAIHKIFQSTKGDRHDAKNVVFCKLSTVSSNYLSYCTVKMFSDISDCHLWLNEQSHKNNMANLLKISVAFLFVCFSDQEQLCKSGQINTMGSVTYCEVVENLKFWVKDNRLIFLLTSKEALVQRLNDVLPKKDQLVCHCEESEARTTGCIRTLDGSCKNTEYRVITVHPDPPQFARPCTLNKTTDCPDIECSCEKLKWKRVKCCDDRETLERDVSSMPTCDPISVTINPACSTPCTPADTTRRPPTTTTKPMIKTPHRRITKPKHPAIAQTETEPPPDYYEETDSKTNGGGDRKYAVTTETTGMTAFAVMGIVAAALILLLLLLLLLLFLYRRRQRKKTGFVGMKTKDKRKHRRTDNNYISLAKAATRNKGKGLEKHQKEKERYLKVSFTANAGRVGLEKKQRETDKQLKVNLTTDVGRVGLEKKQKEKDKNLEKKQKEKDKNLKVNLPKPKVAKR